MWDYLFNAVSWSSIGFAAGFLTCYFTLGRRKYDDHT